MNYAPDMCRKSAHLRNQRKDAAVTLIHVVTVADEFFVSFFLFLMGEKKFRRVKWEKSEVNFDLFKTIFSF
jgi:hypothetical protein